jgi:hypothetical protein
MALVSTSFAQVSGDASIPETVPSNGIVKIEVKTDARFVSVIARKSLFESATVLELENGLRDLVRKAKDIETLRGSLKELERVFVFTGADGKYLVEITYYDPELGIKREVFKVNIGPIPPVEMPVVTWTCDKKSVKEGEQVVLTARLSKPSEKDVTVTPNFGGDAVLFEDYSFAPKACCITIPAGQVAGTATLSVIKDDKKENDEIVTLTIDKVTNSVIGNPQVCNFTILGDDSPGPGPGPGPVPGGDLEKQVNAALSSVDNSVQSQMIRIRQPDGNTIEKKAVHAIGQQYGDIAREVKKSPSSWDIATMVDESKVRVGGVIPSASLPKWLDFFKELTKLQRELDTNDMDDWVKFFEAVETVLTSA